MERARDKYTDVPYDFDHIEQWVGRQLSLTDWLEIEQERVNAFAAATSDMNPLHVDPAAAAEGPFGGPIAHGFLTLSLLTYFSYQAELQPDGAKYGINYGFDRVRFMAPVRIGDRIRNRCKLTAASRKGDDRCVLRTQNTVEIEGNRNPALVASWMGMFIRA
ncbi:MAG: MaoC family dehydratase [Alphaproteobacteria bacterium]|nr:MaoC family dehydratase [Alphaproteobacteria bacterium]